MKKENIIIILILIVFGMFLMKDTYKQKKINSEWNEYELSADWNKDAKEVMKVYINAINAKDIDTMKECIFTCKNYDHVYLGFSIPSKGILNNIKYIKYIDSEEATFRPVEGKLKNGKSIMFKEGKTLDVTYDVKYKIDNQPEESGINDFRYTLAKDDEGRYKIIEAGY
ncbi:DUF4829 domain-containing protein [Romboutsia lituseburensis]|uniref:DUF4829 domain-containing protein n=1 Tax=Romboutsia lituseburensis TaxID=1537 RepID=UPI00215AAD0F|nr:DUF4829 domain-containing protein [Romboutsia lituseburensis]MCR8746897.1 DUF4829 domain-containing protein [Romboutsia lituseburensis]